MLIIFTTGFRKLFCFFLAITLFVQLDAQDLYFEGFDNGIPDDFLLFDVDGQTQNPNPQFTATFDFSNPWIAVEGRANDPAAASHSWYQPAGASDDWMILPAIQIPATGTFVLEWLGLSVDENFLETYEIRVSTSPTITQASLLNDFQLVERITNESGDDFNFRSVSLDAFKGETIFIAFRNISDDKFVLFIDEIKVASLLDFDLRMVEASSPYPEYTNMAISQAGPITLSALVENRGLSTIDSVRVTATVFDRNFSVLFEDDMGGPLASLAAGDSATFTGSGQFVPADTGFIGVLYFTDIFQTDGNLSNDTSVVGYFINDSIISRDNGRIVNLLSLPDSEGPTDGLMGQTFDIIRSDTLTSVGAVFLDPVEGGQVRAVVYSIGLEGPDQLLYESTPYQFKAEDNPNPDIQGQPNDIFPHVFSFPNGVIPEVTPGEYLVAIEQIDAASGMRLTYAAEIFTFGATWVSSPQIANGMFLNAEQLQLGDGSTPFPAFIVRPAFSDCFITAEVGTTPDNGSGNGTAAVTPIGGAEPYSYEWSNGETTQAISGLAPGIYTVTVTDAKGCSKTFETSLNTTSISDELTLGFRSLNVYPNPHRDQFVLEAEMAQPERLSLEVYDMQGKVLYAKELPRSSKQKLAISLREAAPGAYMLRVQTDNGYTLRRIIKE